eukprot:Nk52_evm1s432 gene=Nk52_evmTU1s432
MADTVKYDNFNDLADAFEKVEIIKNRQEDDVEMTSLLTAFDVLCESFGKIGAAFSFVTSDINDKTKILRSHLRDNPSHYCTVSKMLTFETQNNLTGKSKSDTVIIDQETKKKTKSGSRTLLRLVRALKFIVDFLERVQGSESGTAAISTVAGAAYENTLSVHHKWVVRKAAGMAMYTLPNRNELLKRLLVTDTDAQSGDITVPTRGGELCERLEVLYHLMHGYYEKMELCEL